jgi:membrane-associated protein
MLALLDFIDPKQLIEDFGTIGLILIVFVESGLIPAPLPGDSLLFIAGFAASAPEDGTLPHLNLGVLVVGAFVAAVAGGQSGYWIGSRFGVRLFKPDARLFKTKYAEQAEEFFDRRGPRAVMIARFVPFVRTIAPILAGAGSMKAQVFALYNVVGALLWAVGVTLLGYFLGDTIGEENIDKFLLPIVALIVVLSLIPALIEYRKHKRQHSR